MPDAGCPTGPTSVPGSEFRVSLVRPGSRRGHRPRATDYCLLPTAQVPGTLCGVRSLSPEARPVRCANWSERDGIAVVVREQPTITSLQSLKDWVRWAWHPKRIRFDEVGSFVWRRLDGSGTLVEITNAARVEFPDQNDAIAQRVAEFVAALCVLGVVQPGGPTISDDAGE